MWVLLRVSSVSASGRIGRSLRKKTAEGHALSLWVAHEAGFHRTCLVPSWGLGPWRVNVDGRITKW
jgi:hypothetical protein